MLPLKRERENEGCGQPVDEVLMRSDILKISLSLLKKVCENFKDNNRIFTRCPLPSARRKINFLEIICKEKQLYGYTVNSTAKTGRILPTILTLRFLYKITKI